MVAAGLGNGIGSCAPEFVALLRDQGLPVVALTALPHHYESGIAKVNALCAVRDIAQNPPFGWVLIDNAKLARLHHDLPINAYFEAINRDIVEPLDVFNRLNDRESVVPIRMLGSEDLRTLLLGGGILNYHARELSKLSAVDVFEAVRASLADNPIMPSGSDLANVAYLGLVIEASERTLADCPFSLLRGDRGAGQARDGRCGGVPGPLPRAGFRRRVGDGADPRVRARAAGGVSELTAEAEREAGAIQQKAAQHVAALDLGGLERLRPTRVPHGGRAARRGASRRASRPRTPRLRARRRASRPQPRRRASRSAARRPPRSPRAGATSGSPTRSATASADSARARIAGELIAAQQSEDALERFYAVNAMARVDAAYFRDALRNAARDADRHVSDLARRALEKLSRT